MTFDTTLQLLMASDYGLSLATATDRLFKIVKSVSVPVHATSNSPPWYEFT